MENNKNANGQLAKKEPENYSNGYKVNDFTGGKIKKPFPVPAKEMFTQVLDLPNTQQESKWQDLAMSCRIDLHEKLSSPPVAMQISGEMERLTLFTKGNFSIITGAAKSRKSFLISMFMAAALKGNFQDLLFCTPTLKNTDEHE